MGSLGMLFYIVECFPVNLENLAADAVGGAQLSRIDQQVQGNGGFIAITLGESAHEINEIGALDTQGAQVGNGLAELGGLVFNGLLKIGEGMGGLLRSGGDTKAGGGQPGFGGVGGVEDGHGGGAGGVGALGVGGGC